MVRFREAFLNIVSRPNAMNDAPTAMANILRSRITEPADLHVFALGLFEQSQVDFVINGINSVNRYTSLMQLVWYHLVDVFDAHLRCRVYADVLS